jgi:D-alanyl-lipoteichoic acid acyltransferase DltB (MBOAT superfamily)
LLQSGAFPTLLAGPILLLGQFRIVRQPFHLTRPFYRHALLLLLLGTFKIKLLLPVFHFYFETALALAPGWNLDFFRNLLHTGLYYYIRLYLDFSGYTDVVVGICAVMGLKIRHNFRRPYLALSLADFWRRWHITLAAFVRRHVYIPLGGRNRGAARHVLHLGIVFVVIGLWHGLSGAFLLWGLAHGAYMVLEFYALSPLFRRARNVAPRATRVGQYLLTQIFVTLSWLIFFWK